MGGIYCLQYLIKYCGAYKSKKTVLLLIVSDVCECAYLLYFIQQMHFFVR